MCPVSSVAGVDRFDGPRQFFAEPAGSLGVRHRAGVRSGVLPDALPTSGNDKGTALVTGASARIGLAIAQRLVDAGYAVILHASPRSLPRATTEARAILAAGGRGSALAADLADPAACHALIDAASAAAPLRLLVNNAALFEPDEVTAPNLAVLERHLAVNLRAPVMLASRFHDAWPGGRDACVVNLIDQRVLRPEPTFFSYTLAKSALWTATQVMAQAFAAKGVRVNAVGPGPVLPNDHEGSAGFDREVAAVPLGRAVSPDEVAAAVLYLAEARSVTGQFLAVDAGQHLGPGRS